MGVNHRNGDLPDNPQKGVAGPAACEALCAANTACKGYVWNAAGCDGTPPPGYCFLKAKMLKANPESCSCSATKPFPPPAPPAPPAPPTSEITVSMVYSAMLPHTAASPEPFHLTDAGVIGPTAIGVFKTFIFRLLFFSISLPRILDRACYRWFLPHSLAPDRPARVVCHCSSYGVSVCRLLIGARNPDVALGSTLQAYQLEGLYQGERKAFVSCVEEHYSDHESRADKTVKVNVAWDENDYQIDVGTTPGQTEYKRIIDRNAEFGVTHIVYEPANTLFVCPPKTTLFETPILHRSGISARSSTPLRSGRHCVPWANAVLWGWGSLLEASFPSFFFFFFSSSPFLSVQ